MPILTTSVIGLPVAPRIVPPRKSSAKASIAASTPRTTSMTSTPVEMDRPVGQVAQRHMQHGAILSGIDVLAGEHRRALLFQSRLAGKADEVREIVRAKRAFGEVDEQIVELRRKAVEAAAVRVEGCTDVDGPPLLVSVMSGLKGRCRSLP